MKEVNFPVKISSDETLRLIAKLFTMSLIIGCMLGAIFLFITRSSFILSYRIVGSFLLLIFLSNLSAKSIISYLDILSLHRKKNI